MSAVTRFIQTYRVSPPTGGRFVVTGAVWAFVVVVAMVLGTAVVAVVFTLMSFVAASQASGAWRKRKAAANAKVNQPVALAIAVALPLAAYWNNRAIAVVLLVGVVASVVIGPHRQLSKVSVAPADLKANLVATAATLRSGLIVGLMAAAVVQVHRIDTMSLLFVASVVSVYDAGDYLIGAGLKRWWVGPVAGMFGALVVVATMSAIKPAPLHSITSVGVLGVMMVILCPLGQMLGTFMLPANLSGVPAVRRIDSWLLAAPALWLGLAFVG